MSNEEAHLGAVFSEHFNATELVALRRQVMSKFTPERMKQWWIWMLPSMNQMELVGMLSALKATMPAPMFDELHATASEILGERWQAIADEAQI